LDEPSPAKDTVIVVTAQKREQSLNDVPMSITAISGEDLAAKGITDVEGLVKVTPGLSYTESGAGTPVFSLRGVGFYDTTLGSKPSVAVYSDEVSLPFSIMAQGASLDLERVEVLKGPQGTLFGQNATGGAINYVAAKPTSEFAAGANASIASYNTFEATGFVSGPIAGDVVSARLSGRALVGGDWQESYTRDDSLGKQRFYQGRLIVEARPTDTLTLTFNANAFQDNSDTQAAQLIDRVYSSPGATGSIPQIVNYPVAPENNRAADWDLGRDLSRDNTFYQLSMRGDLDISSEVTLTSITAYSDMSVDQLIDQDGTDQTASLTNVTGDLSSFSQEVRLTGDIGPMVFVVGGNYSRDKSSENSLFQFPYTTSSFTTIPGRRTLSSALRGEQDFESYAAFGNIDLDLTDTLTLHGGLRITEVKLDYSSCAAGGDPTSASTYSVLINIVRSGAGLAPITPLQAGECVTLNSTLTPGVVSRTLTEDNVSWRAGIDWEPIPDTLLYFMASKGYKSGSAPTLPAIQASSLDPVTQESVMAYEAGFKSAVINRVLNVSGALFYYDYKDKQLLARRPTILGNLPGLVNVPDSRIQGAELQVDAFPTSRLRLTVAGTYLDSEVTGSFVNSTILGVPADFEGDPFPYTPEFQLVADGEYDFPLSASLDGFVGANVNYRSSTNAGFGGDARLQIDSYTLVDARIGIVSSDGSWRASIFARNLFDEYYWNNVTRLSDVVRRYAGKPRTIGVQFGVNF
tara:strand:- start:1750 stop:3987 length:2238 start_codon:yes stop_codon:yes gene_type:complete